MNQEAEVKKRKSIYIVWIIPFIAMALAGWMIFKHYDNMGYDIKITFNTGDGLVVGKTPLIYNGIKIGQISDLQVNKDDLTKIDVTVTVEKVAGGIAKQGNIFWKVEPKLSLTEVSGLSTILSGVYIAVATRSKNIEEHMSLPVQTTFIASEEAPTTIFTSGTLLTLHADKYDIKMGAPVMYRKLNVGSIVDVNLTDTGVTYRVLIDKKYVHLVKNSSKFWKVSGIEARMSLAGLRVEMDSLASVIAGGISFNSPADGMELKEDEHAFELFDDYSKVLLDKDVITLVSNDGYNIDTKNSHVYFKGIKAGDIISVDYNPGSDTTTFKIKLESSFRHLANKDAHFWIVQTHIGLNEIEGLDAIAKGPYISFETKTKSKELKSSFTLHTKSPPVSGTHFTLLADKGYNLKDGVNVVFRDYIIGSIREIDFSYVKDKFVFDVVIDNKYKHLVNDTSSFYVQSAVEADVSFDGAHFDVGSLASMVNGGIGLKTKDVKAKSTHSTFALLANFQQYQEMEYIQDGGKYFTLVSENLGSVKEGSPVIFKGMKVGKVISHQLNKSSGKVEIKIFIQEKFIDQVNSSTSFYNISGVQVKAGIDGVKIQTGSIESIVTGGVAFKTPLKAEAVNEMHSFELYEDEDAANTKFIYVSFLMENEKNLKEGSRIVYKALTVGHVKSMKLVDDNVEVTALIDEEYSSLLVEDSLFWIEDVSFNIERVKNLSTVLSGAFIKVQKGQSETKANRFFLFDEAPVPTLNKKGLRVIVTGSRLSSLKVGSPVFYRQIKIGSIEGFRLNANAKGVEMKLFIDECYRYLVRENSIFYNATAIGMDVSLFGVKVSTETISTMINGGITMVTPDDPLDEAQDRQQFKLYDAPEEKWLEFSPELLHERRSCTATSEGAFF